MRWLKLLSEVRSNMHVTGLCCICICVVLRSVHYVLLLNSFVFCGCRHLATYNS